MTRALSQAAVRAMNAQETGEVFLVFLRVSHPDLSDDIRVVNNSEDISVDGAPYIGFPFEITLPGSDDETLPRVTVRIDNVGTITHPDTGKPTSIVEIVRSVASPPEAELWVALASSPDLVEVGPYRMTLRQVTYDASALEGELVVDDILNEAWPPDTFLPSTHPGLFE